MMGRDSRRQNQPSFSLNEIWNIKSSILLKTVGPHVNTKIAINYKYGSCEMSIAPLLNLIAVDD